MSAAQQQALTGPHRAALLLLALGEDKGADVWARLDAEEVRTIGRLMADLGPVPPAAVAEVLADARARLGADGSIAGTPETAERLIGAHRGGDIAQDIAAEIRSQRGGTTWDRLAAVNPQSLARYLRNEYPQTVALVLSRLKTQTAARVMGALPEAVALESITRMLSLDPVQEDILEEVEAVLDSEFLATLGRANQGDAFQQMAEIFNSLDRATEQRLMAALQGRDRTAADRIRALMFTFEDLATLADRSVQTLLQGTDRGVLALALKGASGDVQQIFFRNMPERAARLLRDDMDTMGPVRIRDVDDAQARIVALAKELAARGEMALGAGDPHEDLIG
ncbi:MAG: flagellar motor switch protein FliG [Alphaproteobacteria bacterium]|nr:flagellar motor switch protein FliG [Alphaproteobacteria bacterium]MDX5369572.1 flagellar motor switch protein FliG [Alphaproteobacteria bacterium]MDX5464226.1 flagellar motor switch protein FliG [Alphaproteobacteria bacterium]